MNERIKKLAEQAAKHHGHTINFSPEITETLDKFDELILEECCKVVDGHHEPVYDGSILKKYFGVK